MSEQTIQEGSFGERRSGIDRRGSGRRDPSSAPRPYAFRRFEDRRRPLPPTPPGAAAAFNAGVADDAPALTITLTHADLRALLRWLRP